MSKQIKSFDYGEVHVNVKGITPLLFHKFGQNAIDNIIQSQREKDGAQKEKKVYLNGDDKVEETIHRFKNGDVGFPSSGFKNAMIRGGKPLGFVMTELKGAIHVSGLNFEEPDLVKIDGKIGQRFDVGRNPNTGNADLIYRGQMEDWTTVLRIEYDKNVISSDQILQLINSAGFHSGVGDWRPMRNGVFGKFKAIGSKEIKFV